MNTCLRILVLFAAVCLLPVSAIAQTMGSTAPMGGALPDTTIGNINPYEAIQKHWIVAGKVTTLHGDPIAGAKVEVMPIGASAEFRTLVTDFQGQYQTEYWLNAGLVKEFAVDLKVTKKGFLKAHAVIDFGASEKTWLIPITLREPEVDSELLLQGDLMSGLAPRLKKLGASEGLSAAGEKDYGRGVAEFLDRNRSDRALPFFTKVTSRDASCLPCRTMLALAELDSGDWDGAYRNLAEVFNKIQADHSLGRPEPYVALGVMESWKHEPKNAAGFFAEALKYAPKDPLALQELGRSQLLIENWGPADEYLAKAIAAGAKPETRLLRVQALLGEDQIQEANTEMTHYLDGRDVKKMPIQVRQLWAQIENRKKVDAAYVKAKPKGDRALDYLHNPPPLLEGLEPATDQGQLDSILSAVGKTVAEFFGNFPSTSSLEKIHQEKLRRKQKVVATLDQRFRYLCFTPAEAWGPGFDEYRSDLLGKEALPQGLGDGFMLTSGFASAPLVFHPRYQSQSAFRYLGRQKINGRYAYVIAFAQQPAKARLNGTFKSGEISMTTFSQGLAWIDSQNYQITRLHTDLLRPLNEINLEKETTEIAFGEVHFKGMAEGFWLPQQVSVAVDWNGKHFLNEHHYTEYKLFNVEATERIKRPKEVGQASKKAPDSQVAP
jgi:tetratricopeptide (TPR) repeat protein